MRHFTLCIVCLAVLQVAPCLAATIVINNVDGVGEGFNATDQPNANQVGNNPGGNRGEMRMNVFVAAANVWAGLLQSDVTITVSAAFDPKPCNASGVVISNMEPSLGTLPLNQVDLTLPAFYDMGWLPNGFEDVIFQDGFEN